jgi:hypothetical protein
MLHNKKNMVVKASPMIFSEELQASAKRVVFE